MSIATTPQAAAGPTPALLRATPVAWALARAEGRRLLAHPIFVLGVACSILEGVVFARHDARTTVTWLADGFVWIAVATTFLAAFLATSRERRDNAQDTYCATPATPRIRTQAALLSTAVAGLAGATLVTLAVVALGGLDGEIVVNDQHADVRLLELAHAPLYLVLGGALGVLAGSWTHRLAVAAIGALVLFVPPALLSRSLATLEPSAGGLFGVLVPDAAGLPTLTALLALIALASAGALARHDRRPPVAALAIAALGALVGGLAAVAAALAAVMLMLWPQPGEQPPAGEPRSRTS